MQLAHVGSSEEVKAASSRDGRILYDVRDLSNYGTISVLPFISFF